MWVWASSRAGVEVTIVLGNEWGDLHYCETLVGMFCKTAALFISNDKHQE